MAGLHTRVCTISDALIMRCLPASWRQFSPQVVLLAVSVGIYLPLCCSYAPLFTSEDCGQFVHYIVTDDSDIPRFFFTSCWGATVQPEGFYRPLMQLHFHLLYRWFGLAAFPLHFSCLLLFLLVIQAAYAFAFGLFCQRHAAVLSALLVIMHPATSHNIFFSHNSGDLLLALFFMLTLLCCQQNRHPLLTAGMMLCAFASKETGYVLPPLILLYEIIIRQLSPRESIRKHRVMIFLTAAFACFRLVLFNGVGGYGASVHRIDFAIAGKLLFKIKLCAASFHPMFAAVVALLLVLMLLLPARKEADDQAEVVDFVYSVIVMLLLALLVLGSL
ncbi:MAG TPA: hypothetical protein PKM88_13600, partial [bacterium]|nr:hypothetical protein [bacterium]